VFDLEANTSHVTNERLDRIETMLGSLLTTVRWVGPNPDGLDPHSETRHSMATYHTHTDSPQTNDRAKLLPTGQPGYPRDSTVYDRMSDEAASPVALATPVDLSRVAGYISDENVRRT
jgi:hypothetical protein